MLLTARAEQRPYHLGRYPLEVLPRDETVIAAEAARPARPPEPAPAAATSALGKAARRYLELFHPMVDGDLAPVLAPVPDDLARRMIDLKGYGYFMNADQVGICAVPETAWCDGAERPEAAHDHAVVVLVAHGRVPEAGNPAHDWIGPDHAAAAEMRAGEIAVCLARHIRKLGFPARAHITGASTADVDRLAVLAGLAVRDGETLRNPFIEGGFAIAAVTTNYALETDLPLARAALGRRGLRYWWGIDGATSGRERNRRAKRATHLSDYPRAQARRLLRPGAARRSGGEDAGRAQPLRLQAAAYRRDDGADARDGADPGRRARCLGRHGAAFRSGGERPRAQIAQLSPGRAGHRHLRDPALCLVFA
jgi:hypothetical protein